MGLLSYVGVFLSDGLMYALLAMGFYVSYSTLDLPDLSVEGTVLTGGLVFGLLCPARRPARSRDCCTCGCTSARCCAGSWCRRR